MNEQQPAGMQQPTANSEQPTKPWYASRTIWAGLVGLVAGAGGFFGLSITEAEQQELIATITTAAGGVAGLIAIVGRLLAETRIAPGNPGNPKSPPKTPGKFPAKPPENGHQTAGGKEQPMQRTPLILFGLLAGLALLTVGCASGQQGQGETRTVNAIWYVERGDISAPPSERLIEHVSGGDATEGDANGIVMSATVQPSATGEARADNAPTVEGEIPVNLTPGSGGIGD